MLGVRLDTELEERLEGGARPPGARDRPQPLELQDRAGLGEAPLQRPTSRIRHGHTPVPCRARPTVGPPCEPRRGGRCEAAAPRGPPAPRAAV